MKAGSRQAPKIGRNILSILKGGFLDFIFLFMYVIRSSDATVSEDAGIEPRTVATLALTATRSNHSFRSHPQLGYISSTTRLDPIHNSVRSLPQSARAHSQLG